MDILSTIRAEIERMKGEHPFHLYGETYEAGIDDGYNAACTELLSFLSTLGQEPVDFEKELEIWRHGHFHGKRDGDYYGEYLERESQVEIARHFYELGKNEK